MPRPWMLATAALGAALVGGVFLTSDALASSRLLARGRVEVPAYEVLERHGELEVRRYAPRLVAEVEVEGAPEKATNAGFRILAGFIFGGNSRAAEVAMTSPVDRQAASEKIAMTAPVDRRASGDRWVITFTMPAEYTRETLPRPNDPRITIREVPPRSYAALAFSGSLSEPEVQARIVEVEAAVRSAGLPRADAPPIYARYDPPWTPGFLRRNEVLVELALEPAASRGS